MKVKELKQLLNDYSDNDEVILSSDVEGNNFSPLSNIEDALYVPDSKWSGVTYIKNLDDDLIAQGFSEEDLYDGEDGVNAIVLYPVN